jgi:hypothetical protein
MQRAAANTTSDAAEIFFIAASWGRAFCIASHDALGLPKVVARVDVVDLTLLGTASPV